MFQAQSPHECVSLCRVTLYCNRDPFFYWCHSFSPSKSTEVEGLVSKVGFQDGESFEAKQIKVQIIVITSTFIKYRGRA